MIGDRQCLLPGPLFTWRAHCDRARLELMPSGASIRSRESRLTNAAALHVVCGESTAIGFLGGALDLVADELVADYLEIYLY